MATGFPVYSLTWGGRAAAWVIALAAAIAWAQPVDSTHPSEQSAAVSATEAQPAQDTRAWLGVRLIAVPEALASHIKPADLSQVFGNGVMVDNVAANSPAEAAGLIRFDVIVAVDGEAVTEDLTQFVRQLSRFEPGDRVNFIAIRSGRPHRLAVTLTHAVPKAAIDYRYKYPAPPKRVWTDQVNFRGGVLRKTGEGWVWSKFGRNDDSVVDELPPEIAAHVRRWTEKGVGDRFAQVRIERDGQNITLQRAVDDRLVVTRTTREADGTETVVKQTFSSDKELARRDPDTYTVYRAIVGTEAGSKSALAQAGPSPFEPEALPQTTASTDMPGAYGAFDDVPESFGSALPGETEATADASVTEGDADVASSNDPDGAYRRLLDEYAAYLERRREAEAEAAAEASRRAAMAEQWDAPDSDTMDDPAPHSAMQRSVDWLAPSTTSATTSPVEAAEPAGDQTPPTRQFTIDERGRIEIRLRDASGSELLLRFASPDQLAAERPNLYEHYQRLIRAAE